MTPYDKLKSLPNADQYLKPGITFEQLDVIAYAISDNEAAQRLNQARVELFRSIKQNPKHGCLRWLTCRPFRLISGLERTLLSSKFHATLTRAIRLLPTW
jgi:hypothetical protein